MHLNDIFLKLNHYSRSVISCAEFPDSKPNCVNVILAWYAVI